MRLCRFEHEARIQIGFYDDDFVIPISAASDHAGITIEESSRIDRIPSRWDAAGIC